MDYSIVEFPKPYFKLLPSTTSPLIVPADIRLNEATARGESPEGAIKVHYFNNRTDSSKPAASDDRKQHPLAAGQAVKKCRNPVFPIIGCVPAVFLAQCSYPLRWIYPSLWRPIYPASSRYLQPLLDSSNSVSFWDSLASSRCSSRNVTNSVRCRHSNFKFQETLNIL